MKNQNITNKVADLWRLILWSMDNSEDDYSDHDKQWLSRSIRLVIVFFNEADNRRKHGRKSSAKQIIEDLRESRKVSDCSTKFMIDNTGTSLLAHVYNDVIKQDYFKTKTREPFCVRGFWC